MAFALSAARKGGQVLLFGVASPETEISASPFDIFSKELSIKGSLINPYTHQEAVMLLLQKTVDVSPLISHRISIDRITETMSNQRQLAISKAVIHWD